VENKKRAIHTTEDEDGADYMTLIVHTSIPFYHQYVDQDDDVIIQMIVERVLTHLPCHQPPAVLEASHLHRWDISQVTKPFVDNLDGGAISTDLSLDRSLFLSQSSSGIMFPFLGFAGDYFTQSNFHGCAQSANNLIEKMMSYEVGSNDEL
jgi:hypothetical protein